MILDRRAAVGYDFALARFRIGVRLEDDLAETARDNTYKTSATSASTNADDCPKQLLVINSYVQISATFYRYAQTSGMSFRSTVSLSMTDPRKQFPFCTTTTTRVCGI